MKQILRVFFYLVAGSFLTGALLELGIYLENARTRRKAETVLSAIRQLRVGESTLSTTENLRKEFGAAELHVSPVSGTPPEHRFQILVSTPLNQSKFEFPKLWRFGLRPSMVVVDLIYQDEKLISVTYMVDTPVFTASGEPVELAAGTTLGEDRAVEPHPNLSATYTIRPSSLITKAFQIRLGGVLTPTATQEERDAAFGFDLSCISSFRGCEAFCQIMPSVWREAALANIQAGMPPVPRRVVRDAARYV